MDQSEDQEEEKEQYRELDTENAELKDIIDFEYAMQRAQEEVSHPVTNIPSPFDFFIFFNRKMLSVSSCVILWPQSYH